MWRAPWRFAMSASLSALFVVGSSRESVALESAAAAPSLSFAVTLTNVARTYTCSGVLLTPHLVLTARHCVDWTGDVISCAAPMTTFASQTASDGLLVTNAPDVTSAAASAWVASEAIFRPTDAIACGNDIAVVVLADALVATTYATPQLTDADLAAPYEVVGYGAVDAAGDGSGVRRELGNQKIKCTPGGASEVPSCEATGDAFFLGDDIVAGELYSAPGICVGDSGSGVFVGATFGDAGGAIAVPSVFAVVSREAAATTRCPAAILTRTDDFSALLVEGASSASRTYGDAFPGWASAVQLYTPAGGCDEARGDGDGWLLALVGAVIVRSRRRPSNAST